jgi:hypothetical protein
VRVPPRADAGRMLVFGIAFWAVVGLVLLGTVAFVFSVLIRPEKEQEEVVHQPGVHTLSYVVPTGQDPAELVAALHQAGFTAVAEPRHGFEVLEVVIHDERDRARVREVLEHAHRAGFDSPEIPVGAISFEDER